MTQTTHFHIEDLIPCNASEERAYQLAMEYYSQCYMADIEEQIIAEEQVDYYFLTHTGTTLGVIHGGKA